MGRSMNVDHGELRAIRRHVADALHASGGDLPEGLVPPLEQIYPPLATWQPLQQRYGTTVRQWLEPLEPSNRATIAPAGLATSRRVHAMLEGIHAYVTHHATERAITSTGFGPIGIDTLDASTAAFPIPEVGDPTDPAGNQGAFLGHLTGKAIGRSAYSMCIDPARSPLTQRTLVTLVHLSGFFDAMTHRLEELEAMPYHEVLAHARPHLTGVGSGGSTIVGQFLEAIPKVLGQRSPGALLRVSMNSMAALRPIMSLTPRGAKLAARALAWDGAGALSLQALPPPGSPWNPRWLRASGNDDGTCIELVPDWQEHLHPKDPTSSTHGDASFRSEHRKVLFDAGHPYSAEGCPAILRPRSSAADEPRARHRSQPPTAQGPSSSYERAFALAARAAARTSLFDPSAPRPVDIRSGPLIVAAGAEGLAEIDALVASARRFGWPTVDDAGSARDARNSARRRSATAVQGAGAAPDPAPRLGSGGSTAAAPAPTNRARLARGADKGASPGRTGGLAP